MRDQFGRKIDYLRLSVTNLCNLRCIYCMPVSSVEKCGHAEMLSVEEIREIVRAAAACGIRKVRITGGEPLVRRDVLDICREVAAVPGIETVCMTTNGVLLPQFAAQLKQAGVSRLNISIDALDPRRYAALTRGGNLQTSLAGIKAAVQAGFTGIKINAVLLGGKQGNADEIEPLVRLTLDNDFSVRFIELMRMGECASWPTSCFLPNDTVLHRLPELEPAGTDGVARLYRLPSARGTVGLISPVSQHFCPTCSRIRITADGKLKPCLHSAEEIDLRGQSGSALETLIWGGIWRKPARHELSPDKSSRSMRAMNEIGG